LIAGIVLGPMLAGHQGYVLIQTDNYNIETSVTGLVIILILGVVVLFAVEWILRRIFRTGAHTRGWFVGRKRRRARKQTEQALLKLAEGDYQQVEKLMSKNADHAEQPVVNYLLAAEAAQQRGDEARANQHLERASELASVTRFRWRSPAFVCSWHVMRTMRRAMALTACWKLLPSS
jgi:HemY protein